MIVISSSRSTRKSTIQTTRKTVRMVKRWCAVIYPARCTRNTIIMAATTSFCSYCCCSLSSAKSLLLGMITGSPIGPTWRKSDRAKTTPTSVLVTRKGIYAMTASWNWFSRWIRTVCLAPSMLFTFTRSALSPAPSPYYSAVSSTWKSAWTPVATCTTSCSRTCCRRACPSFTLILLVSVITKNLSIKRVKKLIFEKIEVSEIWNL